MINDNIYIFIFNDFFYIILYMYLYYMIWVRVFHLNIYITFSGIIIDYGCMGIYKISKSKVKFWVSFSNICENNTFIRLFYLFIQNIIFIILYTFPEESK